MLVLRRAVNHPSVLVKPRERGCSAHFHHKKWVWRRGLPWQARFLRLVAGVCHGKPVHPAYLTLKMDLSTPFMGFRWLRQVVHRLPYLRKIIKIITRKPIIPSQNYPSTSSDIAPNHAKIIAVVGSLGVPIAVTNPKWSRSSITCAV